MMGPALAGAPLPEGYVGVWQNMEGKAESCRSADWNGPGHVDTHIRVKPGDVEFHEGACRITSVNASEFDDARVTMTCGAEGETYEESEIWAIRKIREHRMLVTTSLNREAGATIVYQHCP